MNACLSRILPTSKAPDNERPHTKVRPTAVTTNFGLRVSPNPAYSPDLAHQITTFMVVKKKKPTQHHYANDASSMPCAGSCRRRAVFTGWENMFLFKDGRLSTEHEDYTEK